jgi:hypothetical protein
MYTLTFLGKWERRAPTEIPLKHSQAFNKKGEQLSMHRDSMLASSLSTGEKEIFPIIGTYYCICWVRIALTSRRR